MNGLELSRAFYEQHGKPMLEREFPELLDKIAVGLFGSGSECFGYDDLISRDHDFEPGFLILLPGEDVLDRRQEFLLERAYAKLPTSFEGFDRQKLLPVGGARHGVFRTAEFFEKKVGAPDGVLDWRQWLSIPEQALAEATNGTLFCDGYGEVTEIRARLRYFPEAIRRKRLAGHLLLMAQSGPYNYTRCLRHGETGAAQLAAGEFVRGAMSVCFLLAGCYQPYYKWSFRALRELEGFSEYAAVFERLLSTGNTAPESAEKTETIERICRELCAEVCVRILPGQTGSEMEPLAYAVNDSIRDSEIRNLHILAAI